MRFVFFRQIKVCMRRILRYASYNVNDVSAPFFQNFTIVSCDLYSNASVAA